MRRHGALLLLGLLAVGGCNVAEAQPEAAAPAAAPGPANGDGEAGRQAAWAALQDVQRAAKSTAASSVERLQALLKQHHDTVLKARTDDLSSVQQTVQVEESWESEAVARMRQALKEAEELALRDVASAADAWARHNAQLEVYEATHVFLDGTKTEEVRAEALREDAVAMSVGAASAATKLVKIGQEAKALSETLNQAHAEGLAARVDQDNGVWLNKASAARQLAQLSAQALTKASKLADVALKQAQQAEEMARKAYQQAMANADRLKELERRAVNAATRATAAASGQTA